MRRALLAAVLLATACSSGDRPAGAGSYPPCGTGCVGSVLCDPASGRCVPSHCSATGCAAGFYCDDFYDFCTTQPHCLSDANCPAGWACHDADNLCAPLGPDGCLSHEDCPAGERCDLVAHVCGVHVPCLATGCGDGWGCNTGYCEPVPPGGCFMDGDCAAGAPCLDGLCAGCASDAAVCGGGFFVCDGTRNGCAECLSSADCPAGTVCGFSAGCLECKQNADCGAARPVCYAYECFECLADADCPSGEVCDPTNRVCRTSSESCAGDAWCPPDRPHCAWSSTAPSRCYECLNDGHCAVDERCDAHHYCRALARGDRCSGAVPLAIPADHLVLHADLAGYPCDSARCLSQANQDAYWTLDLATATVLELSSGDPNYPPKAIEILSPGCAEPLAYQTFTVGAVRYDVTLPAGRVVLRVEGGGTSLAEYWIVLRTRPAT